MTPWWSWVARTLVVPEMEPESQAEPEKGVGPGLWVEPLDIKELGGWARPAEKKELGDRKPGRASEGCRARGLDGASRGGRARKLVDTRVSRKPSKSGGER